MGQSLLTACSEPPRKTQLLLVGLDGAGKTTLLYSMLLGQAAQAGAEGAVEAFDIKTTPTLAFNVETVEVSRKLRATIWDVGGQDKLRNSWRHFAGCVQGVIFVVDSTDVDRMDEAREELFTLMQDEALKGAFVLVYANKQDRPNAVPAADVATQLGLCSTLRGRPWYIQAASAVSGQGLYKGLDWAASQFDFSNKRRAYAGGS
jgi:small GTP-binding protein